VAGRIQVMFAPLSLALPHASSGSVRVLATLLPQRSGAAPDIPTMTEAGFPSVSVPTWQAIFAPAATPRPVIDRIARALGKVLEQPSMRSQLDRRAVFIERPDPDELRETVSKDQAVWLRLIDEFRLSSN
jgi:tripartite-type tricarboxylate transporter receptor subunit TctC